MGYGKSELGKRKLSMNEDDAGNAKKERPLTNKECLFVEHYLVCWNASEAARRSGYVGNNSDVIGPRMLGNVRISRAIKAKIDEVAMSADEVLIRLAQQARFDAGELLNENGEIDLKKAKEKGSAKFIKRLRAQSGEYPSIDLEVVDTQSALALLGKAHKLFTDKHEHGGADGKPIAQKITIEYVNDWRNDNKTS